MLCEWSGAERWRGEVRKKLAVAYICTVVSYAQLYVFPCLYPLSVVRCHCLCLFSQVGYYKWKSASRGGLPEWYLHLHLMQQQASAAVAGDPVTSVIWKL